MTEYQKQIEQVLERYTYPKLERLAIKITSIEARAYNSAYLTTLNKELQYTNAIAEFLTDCLSGDEEIEPESLRMMLRLAMKTLSSEALISLPGETELTKFTNGSLDGGSLGIDYDLTLYVNSVIQDQDLTGELIVGGVYDFKVVVSDTSFNSTTLTIDDVSITEDGTSAYIENYYVRATQSTTKSIYAVGSRSDGSIVHKTYTFNIITL